MNLSDPSEVQTIETGYKRKLEQGRASYIKNREAILEKKYNERQIEKKASMEALGLEYEVKPWKPGGNGGKSYKPWHQSDTVSSVDDTRLEDSTEEARAPDSDKDLEDLVKVLKNLKTYNIGYKVNVVKIGQGKTPYEVNVSSALGLSMLRAERVAKMSVPVKPVTVDGASADSE